MNNGAWILVGAFVSISASWIGLVERPQSLLSSQDVVETFDGKQYPNPPAGQFRYGAEVYRKNGCAYCHTQQVRGTDSDVPRWGIRRTVAEDYAYEDPTFPGSVRIGPDGQ